MQVHRAADHALLDLIDSNCVIGLNVTNDVRVGAVAGVEAGAEQSTLVSATHPQQAPGIYQQKSRKVLTCHHLVCPKSECMEANALLHVMCS